MTRVVLLGPQRLQPTMRDVVRSLRPRGRIAVITAGWQEYETEIEELDQHMGGRAVNLELYRRADRVFRQDPELAIAHRERQGRLRQIRRLYNLRLRHAIRAAQELVRREDESVLVAEEGDAAVRAVRLIDEEHLVRVSEIHAAFEAQWLPRERDAVRRERRLVEELLSGVSAFAVAGGHVAILLNRLRLFDFPEMIRNRPVIAWSAGAMVLGERVVLFHDKPPQGAGNAEALENGLAVYRDVLPFPHARRRLMLDDPIRVRCMARRFAPLLCVPLNEGDRIDLTHGSLESPAGVMSLSEAGNIEPAGAA